MLLMCQQNGSIRKEAERDLDGHSEWPQCSSKGFVSLKKGHPKCSQEEATYVFIFKNPVSVI